MYIEIEFYELFVVLKRRRRWCSLVLLYYDIYVYVFCSLSFWVDKCNLIHVASIVYIEETNTINCEN